MALENLKGLPLADLEKKMETLGHRAFRARQLFRWIYKERVNDFSAMTDLSKTFRQELSERFSLGTLSIRHEQHSSDGTIKYVVGLPDGEQVESVYIPSLTRRTLCISTQVGCKMACSFCATGYQGYKRNLESWEIVEQLIGLPTPLPVTNIVLMGMGEPLDNFENVLQALRIINDPRGPKIGKRHITLSSVGLTPRLQEFVDSDLGHLAISLHGTTEEQRSQIMPINRKHSLKELMETCASLRFKGTRRVTFEYILIQGVNDSDEDARRLVRLVSSIKCKINLLRYNENPYTELKRPTEERVLEFQRILLAHHLTATYRRSRGRDIAAACGQLVTQVSEARAKRYDSTLPPEAGIRYFPVPQSSARRPVV